MCVNLHFFHFNLICNMTTFRNNKILDLLTPTQGSMVCVRTVAYLLSWCSVLNSLSFDMQHDYFQKKIWFDLLTPSLGRGCVCGQKILYHVAACVVRSNMICNMTIFQKKKLASAPPLSLSQGIGPRPSI